MLGVHRPSITVTAGILQRAGLIRYANGLFIETLLHETVRPCLGLLGAGDAVGAVTQAFGRLESYVRDRAGLDDPTAEAAGPLIVNRTVTPALTRAEFLRITLPDPFELSAQVKPAVPPAADPGLTPVTVDPMRPK